MVTDRIGGGAIFTMSLVAARLFEFASTEPPRSEPASQATD
jgi:hypothetical protein